MAVDALIIGESKPQWEAQCLDSLSKAQVRVHRCAAVPGSTGHARAEALRTPGLGSIVTFVDPDDWVCPDALRDAEEELALHPDVDVVYTNELLVDEEGVPFRRGSSSGVPWSKSWQVSHIGGVHHLVLYRLAKLLPLLQLLDTWHVVELYLLHAALAGIGKLRHVDTTGYYWRIHKGGVHSQISIPDRLAAVRLATQLAYGKLDGCRNPIWVSDLD
jgi:hypothetical protein